MNTVAFYTLGCKVNQFDTQAMLEQFEAQGYEPVPFSGPADVYVINTCTVTGTGDKKSMQMIRRALRHNPAAAIVVTGCLAQRKAQELLLPGVMLVLGTGGRAGVVDLLHQALSRGRPVVSVESFEEEVAFEPLTVHRHAERTRAVLKIQEGCNGKCSYCIIPSVRGPIRSGRLDEIAAQARELAAAGYQEIVLTGIHLSSYGKDFEPPMGLLDAIDAVSEAPGLRRLRLGSLEPRIVTPAFARALAEREKVCPQFHLALQSGSDAVLRAMRRQYDVPRFLSACEALCDVYGDVALTTDLMAGFPGEEEAHVQETLRTMERAGFARVHVFPYSEREGTPAATMPAAVPKAERERRAARLTAKGEALALDYMRRQVGQVREVLVEELDEGGEGLGYTPQYVRVRLPGVSCGEIVQARLVSLEGDQMTGVRI